MTHLKHPSDMGHHDKISGYNLRESFKVTDRFYFYF